MLVSTTAIIFLYVSSLFIATDLDRSKSELQMKNPLDYYYYNYHYLKRSFFIRQFSFFTECKWKI